MQPTMCSRCGKNVAVVFITKIENGQTKNEGLCLKCARELHIKPVDDVIEKLGISDEDLDSLSGDMMNALSGAEELLPTDDEGGDDDDGKTATFPFLNRLFGGPKPDGAQGAAPKSEGKDAPRGGKHKFLDNYCIDLTQRAAEGKLDRMIGRAEELERVIQILNRRQNHNPCLLGEPGERDYTALDNADGDLTDQVRRTEEEDRFVYTVRDSSGNETSVERMKAPQLSFEDGERVQVTADYRFNDPGFTAVDMYGRDITDRVEVEGEVTPWHPGDYELVYTLTDDF